MKDKLKKLFRIRINLKQYLPDNKVGRWLKKDAQFAPKYFRDSWRELKKVVWPTRKETWKLFLAVTVFSVVLAALITVVDDIFELIIERLYL